jgi:transposase InsO family protein
MDVSFCVAALEEALATYGTPEIFNTDQGSQFTSVAFTGALVGAGIPAGHFKFLRVWSVKFLHPRGRTRDC